MLDAAFAYQAGTLRMDNTLSSSAVCPSAVCDEAAIFAHVNGSGAPLGEGDAVAPPLDADAGSYSAGSRTIDLGNQNNANNAQLDLAANRIWALVFTIRLQ